jgi:transposase
LRERVFAYADAGVPVGKIAGTLLVSISYVSKVLSRRTRTGETTARAQRCHVPRKLAGHLAVIEAHVLTRPDATLAELRTWLAAEHKMSASLGLLSETLRNLHLTVKKRRSMRPSRSGPMSRHGVQPGGSSSRRATRGG